MGTVEQPSKLEEGPQFWKDKEHIQIYEGQQKPHFVAHTGSFHCCFVLSCCRAARGAPSLQALHADLITVSHSGPP